MYIIYVYIMYIHTYVHTHIYTHICMYTYMRVTTITEKRGHEFQGEQGRVDGGLAGEKGKG